MAKKAVAAKPSSKEVDDGKAFALIGVLLTIIGFVIVLLAKKDNKYAMFYAKQGLVLGIAWIILWVIAIIPVIGWIISILGWILMLILWIIGIVYSLSGQEKQIPIVGQFADKFNI